MTDSQRARMAEELVQRALAESTPDDPVFTGGELDEVLESSTLGRRGSDWIVSRCDFGCDARAVSILHGCDL